ncbi:MAG TPA: acyltransferase [Stellaceae bacterium]|nr:acyltransferase [Stellaceae bacterium]
MSRVPNLTPLRGIAALMIVVFHFYLWKSAVSHGFDWRHVAFIGKSYLAVDFFFLLSGYIIAYVHARDLSGGIRWRAMADFLWARLARIYPLHLYVLLVLVAVLRRVDTDLVYNLLLLQAPWTDHPSWNVSAWSISAEWHAYLAFPVLVAVLYRRRPSIAIGAILGCAVVLVGLDAGFGTLDITNGAAVLLRAIPEFTIGMMIERVQAGGLLPAAGPLALPCAASAVAAALAIGLPDASIVVLEAVLLCTAVTDGASFASCVLNWRPLVFLGDISYSVYIDHQTVFSLAPALARKLLPTGLGDTLAAGGGLPELLALLALVIGCAALTYRFIEVPARRRMRAWRWSGFAVHQPHHPSVPP